jgi:Fe-S-cluster-containing hydrogenase component 2
MSTSRIYWFSGTGNSLYVAKRLSSELGDIPLTQITNESPTEPVGGKGEKIGFVFPSYCCNLPRAVRAFVEDLRILPDTYIFAIVTMGSLGQGSISAMAKTLNAKGLRLSYGRGLKMPANYVLLYNPADSHKAKQGEGKTNERISIFASDIKTGVQSVKSHPFIMSTLYKNIKQLDSTFVAGDSCTSCSLCEKICPVNNIQMENGKPKWLQHCEHCVACISWCPTRAIEYGNKTQSRRRYRNPNIKVDDMQRDVTGSSK